MIKDLKSKYSAEKVEGGYRVDLGRSVKVVTYNYTESGITYETIEVDSKDLIIDSDLCIGLEHGPSISYGESEASLINISDYIDIMEALVLSDVTDVKISLAIKHKELKKSIDTMINDKSNRLIKYYDAELRFSDESITDEEFDIADDCVYFLIAGTLLFLISLHRAGKSLPADYIARNEETGSIDCLTNGTSIELFDVYGETYEDKIRGALLDLSNIAEAWYTECESKM